MVEALLDTDWLLGGGCAALGNFVGLLLSTLLLLGLGLRLEVVEETELAGLALVECLGELVDGWRDLNALQQGHLWALQTDILGPLHKACEVTLWEDVATMEYVRPFFWIAEAGNSTLGAVPL